MKRYLKVLSIILATLLLFIIIAVFIVPNYLEEPLQNALIEEFDKQAEQEYQLDFADLNIDLFSRSIIADSILVQPDSTSPHVQRISAISVAVNGISWWSLLNNDFPNFNSITVIEPKVEILERDLSSGLFSKKSAGEAINTSEQLSTFDLYIENGSGTISNDDGIDIFSISEISLEARKVDINKMLDGSELLFMDDLVIQGAGLKWRAQDNFYDLTIANFSFDKLNGSFYIANMAFTPLMPKYDFSRVKGYQVNYIDLEIPELSFFELDLNSLDQKHINASKLHINEARLEIFRDKQIERREGLNVKPMLNELAHSIDFSMGIDSTKISNATIIYEEHKPPSDSSAYISFDDLDASITNIRTASHPQFSEDTLKLDVKALFMNTAELTVNVSYPVFNEADEHTVKTKLGRLDPLIAHNILKRSGFVRVESGIVESLDAKIELNSESSSGELLILYKDLNISFLNEDSGKQRFQEKLKDFIANNFSIKSENTAPEPDIGEIGFKREIEKSLFAYWWKSLLSGIQDTIQ